ncbi:inner membrane protein import complex subunit Tim54-domain-containing protein [Cantharellus anzutake]|uniref:inner membrane protein import complex subunit Tim54-domain-containing protein n=1 Tax=Cantharellus anzutake TaxID=1750568 RepID=UPI0019057EA6|nr:inner membrane protein import complex subunit Tim54-domain-containing protein [Cantharellus anzutake]KAF8322868.1 inner membrane protein import complex subunit Tim54-domain-containing protein [Cantharellus anzutake]
MSKLNGPSDASQRGWVNLSGAELALEKTGLPISWLRKPKLPSRKWLIFWGIVSTLGYLAWDDKRKCKAIRADYISRVKHLADYPLGSKDHARKVQVYACKWPGDDMANRSMKHFRKYVKPILHAAAVDYEMRNGNYHGAISDLVRERVRQRREADAGATAPLGPWDTSSTKLDIQSERNREMEEGVVIIGRHTLKEYMHGLCEGWTSSLAKVDKEEALAALLAEDGAFDEPDEAINTRESDPPRPFAQPTLSNPPIQPSPLLSMGSLRGPFTPRAPSASQETSVADALHHAPVSIPLQPPFLFVEFPNRIGFENIPMMIYDFFNEHRRVEAGCEAAYRLVFAQIRPFIPPTSINRTNDAPDAPTPFPSHGFGLGGDLDFDQDKEKMYGRGYRDTLATIADARKKYYQELLRKLEVTRSLARGEREPTKDEKAYPPPTEVELRAERLKKELRWREDEKAYQWLRHGMGVTWDDRFNGIFGVFRNPSAEEVRATLPPPSATSSDTA